MLNESPSQCLEECEPKLTPKSSGYTNSHPPPLKKEIQGGDLINEEKEDRIDTGKRAWVYVLERTKRKAERKSRCSVVITGA